MQRNRQQFIQQHNALPPRRRMPSSIPRVPFSHAQRWWRSSLVGYPMALVLTGSVFLLVFLQRLLEIGNYFVGAPLIFVVLLVGWIWGVGPACLALLSGILVIDYWILPPTNAFKLVHWPNALTALLLLVLQLITLYLVALYKRNQQRLFQAEAQARQRAQELEQANELKDHFLSRASHELKTPLTTIRGQAQLALRRLSRQANLPAECTYLLSHLEKIEAQTHSLRSLVDDLLNLSSLRTGKLPLRIAPCDLRRLCQEIAGDLGTLAERPLDLHLPAEPLLIAADEARLSQVVSNLISNALKYSPPATIVRVDLRSTPSHVLLTVHNEGFIPQSQQAALFEPFYRSPDAQSSAIPGWGLGLAISKEIVTQHGGQIWVESSEETGTTFLVTFPRQPF